MLQVVQQLVVGVAEDLHGGGEGIAQAGHFGGAAGHIAGHLVELLALGADLLGEGVADLGEGLAGGGDQGFDGLALGAGGIALTTEQGVQLGHDATAFFQQLVVPFAAAGHFFAQAADHFRRRFRGFRGGLDQAGHGCFQGGAQAAQVFADGAFQLRQALAGSLAAARFRVTQGNQLFAYGGYQSVQAGFLAVQQAGGAVLELAVVFVQGAAQFADQGGAGRLLCVDAVAPLGGGLIADFTELAGDGGELLFAGAGQLLLGIAHFLQQTVAGVLLFGQALLPLLQSLLTGAAELLGDGR